MTNLPGTAANPTLPAAHCRVCNGPVQHLFDGPLLSYRVRYEACARCGYVQTETPHWLDEAYGEAINRSDTGILRRNARTARIVLRMMAFLGWIFQQFKYADDSGLQQFH